VRHRRIIGAAVAAAVALVVAAPMAAAHVTVNPGEAPKGGYAALTFRVPTERDDANTTRLEVTFPTETPIANVRVQPHPGWEYRIERTELDEPIDNHGEEITEVVSKITWTGGEIGPTEFDEFGVSVGPLPTDVDQILFPAIQTYDSGEVVRWIDEPAAEGEEEPETPAPVLTLVDEEEEGGGGSASASGSGGDEAASGLTVENAASQDDVDGASAMGIVGIVVGVLGLLVGGFALLRTRRPAAATED
jgi:periplasmic copper chaperone A